MFSAPVYTNLANEEAPTLVTHAESSQSSSYLIPHLTSLLSVDQLMESLIVKVFAPPSDYSGTTYLKSLRVSD